jgi:N-acetylmuramoyl-L-alanine amidase
MRVRRAAAARFVGQYAAQGGLTITGWRTIASGDSVIRIADETGHFPETIWGDPANEALRGKRTDMNVLMAGDQVFVPAIRPKYEKRPSGATHRFKRKGLPARFRIQLFDRNVPRANQPFTLRVDGREEKGTTDAGGIVSCFVPAQSKTGELVVGEEGEQLTLLLEFGHLDPLNELSGVQHRLTNLGYDCGAGGELDAEMVNALKRFQGDNGLDVTGAIDDATLAKLEAVHDQPFEYPKPPARATP